MSSIVPLLAEAAFEYTIQFGQTVDDLYHEAYPTRDQFFDMLKRANPQIITDPTRLPAGKSVVIPVYRQSDFEQFERDLRTAHRAIEESQSSAQKLKTEHDALVLLAKSLEGEKEQADIVEQAHHRATNQRNVLGVLCVGALTGAIWLWWARTQLIQENRRLEGMIDALHKQSLATQEKRAASAVKASPIKLRVVSSPGTDPTKSTT